MNKSIGNSFLLGLLTLGLFGLSGCQSAKQPGSMSHVSARIRDRSVDEIQQTATAVFRENGYATTLTTPTLMIFERPGSRRDALKWGGWEGRGVTMRVKVRFSELADGSQLLQAEPYPAWQRRRVHPS